jgi:hypothetical protein
MFEVAMLRPSQREVRRIHDEGFGKVQMNQ